jgi:hypothetical protein
MISQLTLRNGLLESQVHTFHCQGIAGRVDIRNRFEGCPERSGVEHV